MGPQKKKMEQGPAGSSYGGVTAKGTLVAGPIQQSQSAYASKYGGSAWEASSSKYEAVNHASAVADYDFGVDEEPRQIKYETYTHTCSSDVANARIAAKLTQAQLAQKSTRGLRRSWRSRMERAATKRASSIE